MKIAKSNQCLLLIIGLFLSSCTSPLDKPLNKNDFPKIKEIISSDNTLKKMKKKFLLDNLSMYLGFSELGKALKIDKSKISTYRTLIDDLKSEYDSTESQILINIENNKKLKNFIILTYAEAIPIDEYNGYLSMKLKFNNTFNKDVLYALINYKYVNKYDSKFFDENAKLTDEVAKDFKGEIDITTNEKYNEVSEFMYKNVPIEAKKELISKLGKKEANKKVNSDFMMEGLKIETLGIVFKDKTELMPGSEDWDYLEK